MAAATADVKVSQPPQTAPSFSKKPPLVQSGQQEVPTAKKAPTSISPAKESQKLAYQPPEPDSKIKKKPAEKTPQLQRRGYGQNIRSRKISLSLRHTYREVQTELTDRERVTSNGITTSRQKVQVSSSEKNDFDTQMNLTMLRIGFGLTDFLEIFGDVGACYDDFEDFNLAYGGGARLNLYEAKSGGLRGFYTALQAEFHKGKLETDYQSVQGNKFSKEADWWDFAGKVEIGLARNRFAVYAGGTYFIYREDTDRNQLENLPPGLTLVKFEDELEEDNNLGAYGGLSFYLTPGLLLNVEGQVITQNSISAAIEYRF